MRLHFRHFYLTKTNNYSIILNIRVTAFMSDKKLKLKLNIGKLSAILIAVCVALVLADLLTKIYEERQGWNFAVIPGFLEVASGSRNPGCAFSFLAEASWGQPLLISLTFIFLPVVIFIFAVLPERFYLLKVALCMIAAGAIGNLIDRLAYMEVRDFIELNMFGSMTSCNLADFWIVLGAVLAVADILFFNEAAVIPLTKTARSAQAKRKEDDGINSEESRPSESNADEAADDANNNGGESDGK